MGASFLGFESPAIVLQNKKGSLSEPFFKYILAESWGCPGMLRMPFGLSVSSP